MPLAKIATLAANWAMPDLKIMHPALLAGAVRPPPVVLIAQGEPEKLISMSVRSVGRKFLFNFKPGNVRLRVISFPTVSAVQHNSVNACSELCLPLCDVETRLLSPDVFKRVREACIHFEAIVAEDFCGEFCIGACATIVTVDSAGAVASRSAWNAIEPVLPTFASFASAAVRADAAESHPFCLEVLYDVLAGS